MCLVSGPYDIVALQRLRRAFAMDTIPQLTRTPTDVFIWSQGEADRRDVTKIGGLPYRAADRPWPIDVNGNPMTFVAQISFLDSRAVVPDLPGDILLLFNRAYRQGPEYELYWGDGPLLEWVTVTETPLVSDIGVPSAQAHIMPCVGSIYSTWDYSESGDNKLPPPIKYLRVVEGTKIGGICPNEDEWTIAHESLPGKFLCSLGSVSPPIHNSYPFLNVVKPIAWGTWRTAHALLIGDVGLIEIYMTDGGELRWAMFTH